MQYILYILLKLRAKHQIFLNNDAQTVFSLNNQPFSTPTGLLVPLSSDLWLRCRVNPEQVTSPSQRHTNLRANERDQLVFGLWEEAEYPERTHTSTWRTCKLHAERPSGQELNPGPSCYKVTVLPTVPSCSPQITSPHSGRKSTSSSCVY
ncbi:hypothetical protein AMECASPLE_039283 [Ameca splendens]|uniref:Uncharacterized protein n=1 Tax=Ameca splendens TaxID=208324 RepID=A0ABV0ZUR5_9TELE